MGPSISFRTVAKHEATGELVAKGNRPPSSLLTMTPHTNFLVVSCSKVPLHRSIRVLCVVAVFVATFVQILRFPFLDPVRVLFWIVGILAALPLVALSVALLQSVLHLVLLAQTITSLQLQLFLVFENVRPTGHRVLRLFITLQEMLPHLVPEPDEVEGVRHGEDVPNYWAFFLRTAK